MEQTYSVPISVKCIVFENDKVWLRKNERNEWELPGGKLDEGEQPNQTAEREAFEELGVKVKADRLVGANLYKIHVSDNEARGVFVVSYNCNFLERTGEVETNGEAGIAEFKDFDLNEIQALNMPDFYKEWIRKASDEAS
jgi:8-oxo-dGTP pyrophosphatase MutT (NUDIX family)